MISVMIPTWNPNPKYLHEAIISVLTQHNDGFHISVSIVDDGSEKVDVQALLKEWGVSDQVSFFRNENNLGIGVNWNRCIELATEEWVHIFHQDDVLLPGFYQKMISRVKENPEIGMYINRTVFIDNGGHWRTLSMRLTQNSGFIKNLSQILYKIDVQCPGIVIRKTVFDEIGVFNSSLKYTLDFEMWARISKQFAVWFEVNPLNCFRIHNESQSGKIKRDGLYWTEIDKLDKILIEYVQAETIGEWNKERQIYRAVKLLDASQGSIRASFDALKRAPYLSIVRKILNHHFGI